MATLNRKKRTRSPHHFDLVDDLPHAFQAGYRLLGELFELEARHLTAKEESTCVTLAPDSLHAQMRLVEDALFGDLGGFLHIGHSTTILTSATRKHNGIGLLCEG